MNELRKQIAQRLKIFREQNKLSQSELSRKTGIGQTQISRFEAGICIPTIIDCMKLADFYDVTLDDLLGRK